MANSKRQAPASPGMSYGGAYMAASKSGLKLAGSPGGKKASKGGASKLTMGGVGGAVGSGSSAVNQGGRKTLSSKGYSRG